MKIVYAGRVTLASLVGFGKWDRPFPKVRWGFPLGSEIVKRLVARGHTVVVVTERTVEKVEKFRCKTEHGGLEVWLVPSWKRSRWSFLTLFAKEMRGMRAAIQEIKPDVVFAQWAYYNAYAGLTSGYPTLAVAHDSPWRVFKMFRSLQTFIKAVYATLFVMPKIRYLTAVSPYIVSEFKKFKSWRNVDIPVIPNGIEIRDERGGMRVERWGMRKIGNAGKKTIVSISQAGRLKNSAVLFKAWEILKPRHPDWRLLVYGQGMPQGMATREELDRVLREEADLFVSPSLEESFGMVFVEAMRFGVPCIGGEKSGAVPWVLGCEGMRDERRGMSDEGCGMRGGVVCDVTRPEKLAECIERVMGDEGLRKRLGEGGRRRVKEMFDIEKVVDLYEKELERVRDEGWEMRDEIGGMGDERWEMR